MRSSERLPTVLRDVLGDETLLDLLDIAGAAGELIHELLRHPRDLPRGCAPRTTLTSLPPDTEDLGEAVGEDSVVMLREPCDGSVQRSGIERAPLPIRHRLHSVRDHNESMELRVLPGPQQPTQLLLTHRRSRGDVTSEPRRPEPSHAPGGVPASR